jgi:tRNA 2-thiocytidine biosynthesis protein TtcA
LKRLLGDIRRADNDFHMIEKGDRIAVGVSGGKDSMVLLRALSVYAGFDIKPFSLMAFTLGLGEPFDIAPISDLCGELDIPFTYLKTDLFRTLFGERKEVNPCSLCAKLRRGALVRLAVENGCNKLALGHNREDVLETLMMSVLFEGRLHTFSPVTKLDTNQVTVIRPMVYTPEKQVTGLAQKLGIRVVKNPCPIDGHTARREMKDLLDNLCKTYPRAREYMLSALKNESQYGLWEKEQPCRKR